MFKKAIMMSAVATAFFVTSCESGDIAEIKKQLDVVEKAKSFEDYGTAIVAMHQVIQMDPNQHAYLDSLASLYYENGQMESAYLVAADALTYQVLPNTLRIASASARATGRNKEALDYAKSIEEANPGDVSVKFDMGLDYANLGDIASATDYFQKVTMHPKAGEISFAQYTGNSGQKVSYLAAAYNALGYIYMQQGEFEAAAGQFKKALEAFPDYKLADNNLRYLAQILQQQQQQQKK